MEGPPGFALRTVAFGLVGRPVLTTATRPSAVVLNTRQPEFGRSPTYVAPERTEMLYKKTRVFFGEFSLSLSRACLGKMIGFFSIKWRKGRPRVFLPG